MSSLTGSVDGAQAGGPIPAPQPKPVLSHVGEERHGLAHELGLLDLDPWLPQQPREGALPKIQHPQVPLSVVDVAFDQQPPAVLGEVVAEESGPIRREAGPGLAGGG